MESNKQNCLDKYFTMILNGPDLQVCNWNIFNENDTSAMIQADC